MPILGHDLTGRRHTCLLPLHALPSSAAWLVNAVTNRLGQSRRMEDTGKIKQTSPGRLTRSCQTRRNYDVQEKYTLVFLKPLYFRSLLYAAILIS